MAPEAVEDIYRSLDQRFREEEPTESAVPIRHSALTGVAMPLAWKDPEVRELPRPVEAVFSEQAAAVARQIEEDLRGCDDSAVRDAAVRVSAEVSSLAEEIRLDSAPRLFHRKLKETLIGRTPKLDVVGTKKGKGTLGTLAKGIAESPELSRQERCRSLDGCVQLGRLVVAVGDLEDSGAPEPCEAARTELDQALESVRCLEGLTSSSDPCAIDPPVIQVGKMPGQVFAAWTKAVGNSTALTVQELREWIRRELDRARNHVSLPLPAKEHPTRGICLRMKELARAAVQPKGEISADHQAGWYFLRPENQAARAHLDRIAGRCEQVVRLFNAAAPRAPRSRKRSQSSKPKPPVATEKNTDTPKEAQKNAK